MDPAEQTHKVMKNIKQLIEETGWNNEPPSKDSCLYY
jgi:hypothetical protein